MKKKFLAIVLLLSIFFGCCGFSSAGYPVFALRPVLKVLVNTITVPKEDLTPGWHMILVNESHPLAEDYTFEQATVSGYIVDARIAQSLTDMLNAADQDGIHLIICSAYRSIEKQTTLFNRKINYYTAKGYSYQAAYDEAKTIVAIPGTSEHHTGLALDIVTPAYQQLNSGFENTDAFAWLTAHCAEYGFILRYPSDKCDITGIIYEPWHYRYVGTAAAKEIMSQGICLEEYLTNSSSKGI